MRRRPGTRVLQKACGRLAAVIDLVRPLRLPILMLLAAATVGGQTQAIDAPSLQAQAVIAHWSALKTTTVDARASGARGDGAIAGGCSIPEGTATLTCDAARFSASDVGKVIAIERAGRRGPAPEIVQPLATTIRAVVSASTVTLAVPAATSAMPSPRVVWGTDDTQALQRAIDSLAPPSLDLRRGGILTLPPGRYLARGVSLPCSRTGDVERGHCARTYNNIWIKGAGPEQTFIENWDPDAPQMAVIRLGERAGTPDRPGARNQPLAFVAITDLAVRQVPYASQTKNAIRGDVTDDVWVLHTRGENFSYECYVDGESRRWRVHDNVMGPCGHGGPAYRDGTSALNLTGWNWIASRNHVSDSPQAAEVGGYGWTLEDNVFDGPINATGGIVGQADGIIRANTVNHGSILVSNSIGTSSRTQILDNVITDGSIGIGSGLDVNPVTVPGYPTGPAHGTSLIRGNRITIDEPLDNAAFRIGLIAHRYTDSEGLESVLVENNQVTVTRMFGGHVHTPIVSLSGPYGGRRWMPQTAYTAAKPNTDTGRDADTSHVVPTVDNGFFYVAITGGTSGLTEPDFPTAPGATVGDGTVVWQNHGPRPLVTLRNNRIEGPPGAVTSGRDITLMQGTGRAVLVVEPDGFAANYDWRAEQLP